MQFIRSRGGSPTSGRRVPPIHAINHGNVKSGGGAGRQIPGGDSDQDRWRRFLGMTCFGRRKVKTPFRDGTRVGHNSRAANAIEGVCPLRRLWGLAPSRRATQFEFDEASVKYRFGGFFCACLLLLSTLPGRAQQQPTPVPEPGQNPPASQGPVTKQPPPLPPRAPDRFRAGPVPYRVST